ncbi:MAG: hypothetical protein COT73_03090 [Bdellovibrio sp. CG10_big_fil_rev_8_21_14_0_10_47_8]|nr:MAG: hypothetical protein COT73_03090 [Bdellovibrio sp. CG10_big_fil_rev_8_21_14_0_10_47_8]
MKNFTLRCLCSIFLATALFAVSTGVSFAAHAESSSALNCIEKRDIRRFHIQGRMLILESYGRNYQVDVRPCFNFEMAERIRFRDSFSKLCTSDVIYFYDGFGRLLDRCLIRSIQ